MDNFFKHSNYLIKKADLFGTSKFYGYKSRLTFQSLFGGVITILMLTVITVIVYQKFQECINRQKIYSTDTKIMATDPTIANLSTFPKGNFMAGIRVQGLNLTNPQIKYFNTFSVQFIGNITDQIYHEQKLQPCTFEHWGTSPEIIKSIQLVDISTMMCLPKNKTYSILGKMSSVEQRLLSLVLKKIPNCDPTSGDLPRFATEAQFRNFFGNETRHKIQLYFTNYHIAPDKKKPINQFLDDRNVLQFTETIGAYSGLYVQDFKVSTDQSINFNHQPKVQTGELVDEAPITYTYVLLTRFAQFQFSKSLTSRNYERRYEKISEVFALAGGLYGALCYILIIVKFYNNSVFSISLGEDLFKSNQTSQLKVYKNYTFLSYIKLIFYTLLKKFGCHQNWKTIIEYKTYQKQARKHVDIVYFLQRILFLQSAISVFLQDHQITGLHLREKLRLSQAQQNREHINFKKEMEKMSTTKCKRKNYHEPNDVSFNEKNENRTKTNLFAIQIGQNSVENDGFFNAEPTNHQILYQNDEIKSQAQVTSENYQKKFSEQEIQNYYELLKELKRVKDEGKKGYKVSKKIMDLSGPALKSLLRNLSPEQQDSIKSEIDDEIIRNMKKMRPQNCDQNGKKVHILIGQTLQTIHSSEKSINATYDMEKKPNKKSVFSSLKFILTKIDIFSAKKFFRYQSQKYFRTKFGGVLTIFIILALLSSTYYKMIDCINQSTIYSSEQKRFSTDPILMTTKSRQNQKIMVDLNIELINVNDPKRRYFDFSLKNIKRRFNETTGNWTQEEISYSLEKCTQEHWEKFEQFISSDNLFEQRLCFPLNISTMLQGRRTSHQFDYLELVIQACKNSSNLSVPCDLNATSDYLNYSPFTNVKLRILNPIINHRNKNYIEYYLEQRAFFMLSFDLINIVDIYVQDYTIITDQSIFPWNHPKVETGFIIEDPPLISTYDDIGNTKGFARIKFLKSFHSKIYHRTFQKLQEVFAFIGGLFRIIFFSLFVVNYYNNLAYQLTLCSKVFEPQKSQKNLFKKYNFLSFCIQSVHNLLSFIKISPKWQSTIEYKKCQEEMEKQLDVMYILKRLDFLQCCVETILQRFEAKSLRLIQKPTLEEAKEQRKVFNLKKYIKAKRIDENPVKKENFEKKQAINKNGNIMESLHALNDEENPKNSSQIEKESSSNQESDDDSFSNPNQSKNQRILQQIKRLKEQARIGNRISKKIADQISHDISPLVFQKMSQSYDNRTSREISKKKSLNSKNYTKSREMSHKKSIKPYVFQVEDINGSERSRRPSRDVIAPFKYKRTLYPIISSKDHSNK